MENGAFINNQANDADEITLKLLILTAQKWWRYLLTKWVVILFAGIIGGLAGLGYSLYKKPIYTAELSFALDDEKSSGGIGGALGLASQFGIDLGGQSGGAFSGDNLIELMKSRLMVESTLLTAAPVHGKAQTLAELYISFNKLREEWAAKPALKNIRFDQNENRSAFSRQQDSVLGEFYNEIIKNDLVVDKVDKKLTIVKISFKSKNELFAKIFSEVLVKNVSDFYIQTKTKKSAENVNILQHQTDSVRRELNIAINGVASSVDAIPNANPGRQILRAPSQHKQVDVTADQAILTELVKNLEASKVGLRKETPLIQIIDLPILPLAKQKASKLISILLGAIISGAITIFVMGVKNLYANIIK